MYTYPLIPGTTFLMDGGDGDQDFFGEPKALEYVEVDWFPENILRGRAYLFIVKNGKYASRYAALTSKTVAGISEQLHTRFGVASVVVHLLQENPENQVYNEYFQGNAIGMSVIVRKENVDKSRNKAIW